MGIQIHAVENRKATVFGVTVYFAVCHDCRSWVKSSTGQYCWTDIARRNTIVRAHRARHRVEPLAS